MRAIAMTLMVRSHRLWHAVAVLALGLAATAAQAEEVAPVETDFTVWRALLPVLIITALGAAAWVALRVYQNKGWQRQGPLRIVQGVSLGPRERLVVVSVTESGGRERRLLLGATPQQIRLVDRIDTGTSAPKEQPQDGS